jgi:hypothetical protein
MQLDQSLFFCSSMVDIDTDTDIHIALPTGGEVL